MFRAAKLWLLLSVPIAAWAAEPPSDQQQFSEKEIESIEVPDLAFVPKAEEVATFEKYYYFQRDGTTFDQALADINECDGLASGLNYYRGSSEPYTGYYAQYGVGGAIGAAIGEALGEAIYGSAKRRAMRRINMRNCMGFKGYQRFGLRKSIWTQFNFEEGNGREDEDTRRSALLKQARIASGPKPQQEALEP